MQNQNAKTPIVYYKCSYCWAWRQIYGEFLSDDVWTFNEEQQNNLVMFKPRIFDQK